MDVVCVACGKTLEVPGALLFSPPDSVGYIRKDHICLICYTIIYPGIKKKESVNRKRFKIINDPEPFKEFIKRGFVSEEDLRLNIREQVHEDFIKKEYYGDWSVDPSEKGDK